MTAIIFDMDGTLLDLPVEIAKVRARLEAMFLPQGYSAGFRPILPCIDKAASIAGANPSEVKRYRNEARHVLAQAEISGSSRAVARPGAVALVGNFVQQEYSLGVVTDNARGCVKLALEHAGFAPQWWSEDSIVSRDDVSATKPSPDGVLTVAQRLAIPGETVWYIGDSIRDIVAGKAAGENLPSIRLVTVAVDGGRSSHNELANHSPDWHVGNIADIADIVRMNS